MRSIGLDTPEIARERSYLPEISRMNEMTKHMKDYLLTNMMRTGKWCPDELEVHVASDVFYSSDPLADCIRNGCYCIQFWQTPSLWWHLPVAETDSVWKFSDDSDLDVFASVLWYCSVDG